MQLADAGAEAKCGNGGILGIRMVRRGWAARCSRHLDVTTIEVRPGAGRGPTVRRMPVGAQLRRRCTETDESRSAGKGRNKGRWGMMGEGAGQRAYNGVPAGTLRGARWRKSRRSSAQGNCVETARLPGDQVAVRNSRHPQGPALIFSQAEVRAFVAGVKDGDFDSLLQ
jgi:hypothetical protein